MTKSILLLLSLSLSLSACASSPPAASTPPASTAAPAPAPGGGPEVPDMGAFNAFVATHPTQAAFRASYPKVDLITPDMITTQEMRSCCSRYYGTFDDKGNVTGGSFH